MRHYLAWAAGLLLATACQRHDDPITQQQQDTQKQEELATDAAMVQTPREAAIWKLVQDFRELHYRVGVWAGTHPSDPRFPKPLTRYAGMGKTQRIVQIYPTLAAYRADLQRRADSLRQTGPLDLSDTLYTPTQEGYLQRNVQQLLGKYESPLDKAHRSH